MRVASAQLAPAFMQREATLDKVLDAIGEAAANGAQLIAFPETFVPGYPAWADFTHASTFDDPAQKAAFSIYLDNAVDIAAGHLDTVVAVSAQLGIFVYLGVAERSTSGGSIYCSLVAIDPTLGIVSVHRKLKPTYGERMMWADGDGNGLVVHDLVLNGGGADYAASVRVSGLNCWENWMPLTSPRGLARRRHQVTSAALLRKRAECSWSARVPCCVRNTCPSTSRFSIRCSRSATAGQVVGRSSSGPTGVSLPRPRSTKRRSSMPISTSRSFEQNDRTSTRRATTRGPTSSS